LTSDSADDPALHGAETVFAIDNVPLELPIAGAGTRVLAGFLDYLLVLLGVILWGVACIALYVTLSMGGWAVGLFLVGLFVIEYGYFAISEAVTGGRTFGKWALDMEVVMRHGGRASTGALLLRNAVRFVDLWLGVPLMASDALSRRLGDRIAGTLVVQRPGTAHETIVPRVPRGWGAREVALIESFLHRAAEFDPQTRERIAGRLLAWIHRDDPDLLAGADTGQERAAILRRALGVEGA
jgi:uncharacterized RDD family membrane protein YckC